MRVKQPQKTALQAGKYKILAASFLSITKTVHPSSVSPHKSCVGTMRSTPVQEFNSVSRLIAF